MTVNSFSPGGEPPQATIILPFNGTSADIPNGWVLCDGMNGTPDLRGKHLKSVPDTATDPGGVGGQDSVSLTTAQIASHTHGGSTDSQANHNHAYGYGLTDGTGNEWTISGSNTTSSGGGHSHTFSTGSVGSGSSIDNKPAHMELNYIQKV